MDKLWNSIVRNSLWMVAFGILLIVLGVFIYKKGLFKRLPAWLVVLLCLTQFLGKGIAAVLYGQCYKVSADAYRLIHRITLVGNVTEIVTAIIILVILVWNIRCLKMD